MLMRPHDIESGAVITLGGNTTAEVISRKSVDGSIRYFNSVGQSGSTESAMAGEFMQMRLDYVKAMGWLPEDTVSDIDPYDLDPTTLVLLAGNPREKQDVKQIFAGMRLTPTGRLEDSLSWSMLNRHKGDMRDQALTSDYLEKLRAAERDGQLLDLTRLTTAIDDRYESVEDIARAVLDLIGAGIVATVKDGEPQPAWLFLTTAMFRQFLVQVGIKHDVLSVGKVSESDDQDSYLCVAYPQEALSYVAEGQTSQHVRTYSSVMGAILSFRD